MFICMKYIKRDWMWTILYGHQVLICSGFLIIIFSSTYILQPFGLHTSPECGTSLWSGAICYSGELHHLFVWKDFGWTLNGVWTAGRWWKTGVEKICFRYILHISVHLVSPEETLSREVIITSPPPIMKTIGSWLVENAFAWSSRKVNNTYMEYFL